MKSSNHTKMLVAASQLVEAIKTRKRDAEEMEENRVSW